MDPTRVAMTSDQDQGAPLTYIRGDNVSRLFKAASYAEMKIWEGASHTVDYQKQIFHFSNALEVFIEDYQKSLLLNNIISNPHDQLSQDEPCTMRQQTPQLLLQAMGGKQMVPDGPLEEVQLESKNQMLFQMQQQMMHELSQTSPTLLALGRSAAAVARKPISTTAMLLQQTNSKQQQQQLLHQKQCVHCSDQVDCTNEFLQYDIRHKQLSLMEKYGKQLLAVDNEVKLVSTQVSLGLVDSPCFNVIDKELTDAKNAVFNLQQLLCESSDSPSKQLKLRNRLTYFEEMRSAAFCQADQAIRLAKRCLQQEHQKLLQSQGLLPLQQ